MTESEKSLEEKMKPKPILDLELNLDDIKKFNEMMKEVKNNEKVNKT